MEEHELLSFLQLGIQHDGVGDPILLQPIREGGHARLRLLVRVGVRLDELARLLKLLGRRLQSLQVDFVGHAPSLTLTRRHGGGWLALEFRSARSVVTKATFAMQTLSAIRSFIIYDISAARIRVQAPFKISSRYLTIN